MFAIFETDNSDRHLKALCDHFGKKVLVECYANAGWVQFYFGRCDMIAEPGRLKLQATAINQKQIDEVVAVMTSHLERYAFRENPILEWQTKAEMTVPKVENPK